jgi:dUTP pyrophosphatase
MSNNSDVVSLGVHKLHNSAFLPEYATEGSACFDVRACFPNGKCLVKCYSRNGKESAILAAADIEEKNSITILSGDRVMVPTQLVLDIPNGWSVRLHMRSGLAIKGGLVLSNSEGVIDSDYTDQLMILVTNTSEVPVRITHGDRICQGEMVPVYRAHFVECQKPSPKTSRDGGFGSTGKS